MALSAMLLAHQACQGSQTSSLELATIVRAYWPQSGGAVPAVGVCAWGDKTAVLARPNDAAVLEAASRPSGTERSLRISVTAVPESGRTPMESPSAVSPTGCPVSPGAGCSALRSA